MLVNEGDMVQYVASAQPLGFRDHVVVAFDFMCYYGLEDVETIRCQFVTGDYEAKKEEMKGVNWDEELCGKDVNGMWDVIGDQIADRRREKRT